MKTDTWKLIKAYLRQYRNIALIFCVCAGIFFSVFWLYRIETDAVVYAAVLCILILVIAAGIHFWNFRARHNVFLSLMEQTYLESDHLPYARNLSERDYRQLVLKWFLLYKKSQDDFRIFKEESGEYYSTWAHQIKTPIAVMRLMLQEEDTEKNRKMLIELSRIEQYADMVLDYFRLDSSGKDLVIKEYELDSIIRSCIRKYASWFVEKRLTLDYEGTKQTAVTDQKWLSMILEQILSNAIKYTESGRIEILVTEGPKIYIKDTGIGIAKEDIPRIFDRGFTGYNGRANEKSTGIGLYLVKKASALAGARVSVESVIGKGSSFCVDLREENSPSYKNVT